MRDQNITLFGAIVNILLAVVKITGGAFAGSRALIADGIHSLSDLVTDAVVFFGVQAADRPPDEIHTFGHGRYETISALFVGFALLAAGVFIGYDAIGAISRAMNGSLPPRPGLVAALIAGFSIIVKEVLYQLTYRVGMARGSAALTANAWHHRTDALSSLAALIGVSMAMILGDGWRIMDPVAAIVVAFLVAAVGVHTVWRALREMTDAGLPAEEREIVLAEVRSLHGVSDPHNLKTRWLGTTLAVEIHFRVDGRISVDAGHELATQVEERIRKTYGPETRVITHVEPIRQNGDR